MNQRFEHTSVCLNVYGKHTAKEGVRKMELEGWELCGVESYSGKAHYWFKRPVDAESKSFKTLIPQHDSLDYGG